MTEPQIAVDKVSHVYRPPRGKPVLALDDISFEVRPREKGAIAVNGAPVKAPGPDRGIVFQHFALFPWKTVRENGLYGLERQSMPKAERLSRAKHFIDL